MSGELSSPKEPYKFSMPTMADLVAEYRELWPKYKAEYGENHLREFCSGSADSVHDTYLDSTVAFAFDFEAALYHDITTKGL